MARFDIHTVEDEPGYLLDCQSNLLRHFNTRIVVPLRLPKDAPVPGARLNPIFEIDGVGHVMVTQFAAAVSVRALGPVVGSLSDKHDQIVGAFDVLITDY